MLLRIILFTHRYAAVAVGLLVSVWCLSGFVMMYQEYPAFTTAERLRSLTPLDLSACCNGAFLPDEAEPLADFRIEMLRGEPVIRQSGAPPVSLRSGEPIEGLQHAALLDVAYDYSRRVGIDAMPTWLGEVSVDQWTIQTARRNQPVHQIDLNDAAGTELYLNGAGEIFQDTSRRERILTWLGAIPHWLYPLALRRNGPLWSQIVIWTSVLGTFLTLTGLYVGISRLQRRGTKDASVSPFRGWWYWHHMFGLFFGVLALTWVASGLLTMNPWGLLEGSNIGGRVHQQLRGEAPNSGLRQFLQAAPGRLSGGEFVQLRSESFGGKLQVLALRADGSSVRLDENALPDPLQPATVEAAARRLDTGVTQFEKLDGEDPYYYSHKIEVELPVYRAILADAQQTRIYISPTTGALLNVVDADARKMRWLERALHGLDFRGLRSRPLWDIVTLLLLAGVTALAITGTWMALKRIKADLTPQR